MAAPIEPSDEASDIEEARSISFEHSEGDRSVADVEEDLGESDVVEENPVPHTNEGEIPDATADEENQYDDEFASMSEGIIASEAIVSDPGEIVEDSEGAEMSDDNSVHDGSEYEDDFASMSENPVESAKESGMVSAEVDYEEQDVAKDSGANDVDDISEDEIVEDENSSQKFAEKFHSGEIATSTEELGAGHTREIVSPNEEPHYSEDVFESGHLEQHSAPSFEHNQSVSGVEGHSTSEEDSSTTKLLVAEVAKMQTLSKVAQQARKDDVDDKLARKKAKTEELLQAKELLFRHQKDVFRRDEEKRQVDHFAKMALGMDVESELRQAKAEISQLLAREFDALHQTYPMLKGSSSKTAAEVVPKLALPASEEPASAILTVLGKSSEKGSVDEYDDDYDVESFEDEQGGIRASIKASSFEVASKGGEIQELDESHKYVDDELENATSEVASEVPSHQSGDLLPSAVDEEEDYVDDEQDGKAIDEDYDGSEDYENDYENESFDDVQSSSAVLTEDRIAEVAEIGEESKADNAIVDDLVGKDEYQDDDEMYSDEGFDSASGSSAQEPSSTFALENKTIAASIEIIAPVAAEASTQEEELADAIESVTAQLEDERRVRPLDLVHSDYNTQGLAFENAADECRPLDTSVSVSLSRDEEEGLLTKSIEERKARLEVLRQKILDRKDEIILVQKQMRVERRKEQLAAEEKLLWDEMESVESFDYVETTYKVSLSSSIEFIGEQLHTSEQNADEKQQAAEVHSDEDEDDNETSSNRPAKREPSHDLTELSGLISESLTPAGGTLAQLADFSENAGGDDSDVSVEESVKDLSAELDAMDLGDIDETVDSQTYQTSANETQPTVERREEELADRVATLLLDDLLQALDNVFGVFAIRMLMKHRISIYTIAQILMIIHRDLDRSIDKASSLDASESYSMDYAVEDDRVSEQSHQMESPSSSVRADTSNGIPIERGINFASDTEHTQVSVVPAEGEIGENETSTDMESMIERVTDSMFATMFDTTMMSELRIWSHQHEAIQSPKREIVSTRATVVTGLTGTTGSRVGMVSSGIARELATQGQPKTRTPDIDLTQQVLDQINIVDGKLILPTFDTLEFETTQDAHALYDTIYELAQGCFDSLQQSAHDERNLDNSSMLAVIYRQVQAEIDELLEIRAQSEGELERQLRLLSDEPEITSSVLLSHNCLESNVSTMVAKVQTQLTRTTEALSTAQTPRYGVWPRTPTSRTKSTSVLSSLQAQQDEELQQRITSMILSDLLHDAGLP
ncbi:hypothetical protein PHYBOEH_004073 [Phytophthora boehmeriae]|uniref:Uncharacterized protein n=1 Tax=Phytophthora boehmeriae TaxID=109152 RepID=A0A8T1X3R9_9STRA|nr:hypothetical protein PHYBOEH_004073 [Phytophthora boehmeriae]